MIYMQCNHFHVELDTLPSQPKNFKIKFKVFQIKKNILHVKLQTLQMLNFFSLGKSFYNFFLKFFQLTRPNGCNNFIKFLVFEKNKLNLVLKPIPASINQCIKVSDFAVHLKSSRDSYLIENVRAAYMKHQCMVLSCFCYILHRNCVNSNFAINRIEIARLGLMHGQSYLLTPKNCRLPTV